MNNKIFLPLLFFMLIISCTKKKKSEQEILMDFAKNYTIYAQYDENKSKLTISVELKNQLHAYAPGEKIGKAVNLEIKNQEGWAALGPSILPKGEKKILHGLGESFVLQNRFTIEQLVSKGKGRGVALLHMQVCTSTQCDRPRVHEIPFN